MELGEALVNFLTNPLAMIFIGLGIMGIIVNIFTR